MVAKVAYEVVAEFVFEEAVAIAATNKMTRAVENLSKKVDQSIFGVARMGAAYLQSFAFGGGGILGLLGSAISSSEKFRNTQIELANVMISNRFKNAAGEYVQFNEAMEASVPILDKISKTARNANISTIALANSTKLYSTVLGAKSDFDGDVFGQSIDLARVQEKARAALNLDSTNMTQQILNAISGNLSKGTLFGQRIFAESGDVFKQAGVSDVKGFNALKVTKRVEILTRAMDKLAGGAEIVEARSQSLSQRLLRLRDSFVGLDSVLRPLGNTLMNVVGPALDIIIDQINTKGRHIVRLLNMFFNNFAATPEQLYLNTKQFASLHGDIAAAGKSLRFLAISIFALKGAAALGILPSGMGVAGAAMATGAAGIGGVGAAMYGLFRVVKFLLPVLKFVGGIVGTVAAQFAGLVFFFQIFSRAVAKAEIQYYKLLSVFGDAFLDKLDEFSNLMGIITEPFNTVIEYWSDLIAELLVSTTVFEIVLGAFNLLNKVVFGISVAIGGINVALRALGAGLGAFFGTLFQIMENPTSLLNPETFVSPLDNMFEAMAREGNASAERLIDRLMGRSDTSAPEVKKDKMDVKVTNTFNIKEQIEPDRIAFTIDDQLRKINENRRSAVGRPLIPQGA
jgi:hypothetical protein